MVNMIEDWRDQKIMTLLSENPKGLRHAVLLEKIGFAKKTLQTHLDYLVSQNLIEKIKDLKKRKNTKTVYKVILSKDDIEYMKELTKLTLSPIGFLKGKGNKKSRLSSICHLIQIFSTYYYHCMLHYLVDPDGKIRYSTHLKMLENRIEELRIFINDEFSEKQILRINDESIIINNSDYDFAFDKFTYALAERPYYRTLDEIVRDNELIPIYDDVKIESENDSDITMTRLELIKDKKLTKKLEKLEDEYESLKEQLLDAAKDIVYFHAEKDRSSSSKKIKKIMDNQWKIIEPKIEQNDKEEKEFMKKFV